MFSAGHSKSPTTAVVRVVRSARSKCACVSYERLGSLVVRAADLRLNGCEFDHWPPHYQSLGTGMVNRLRAGIPSQYITSHLGQLSLLPSVGREMNIDQRCAAAGE